MTKIPKVSESLSTIFRPSVVQIHFGFRFSTQCHSPYTEIHPWITWGRFCKKSHSREVQSKNSEIWTLILRHFTPLFQVLSLWWSPWSSYLSSSVCISLRTWRRALIGQSWFAAVTKINMCLCVGGPKIWGLVPRRMSKRPFPQIQITPTLCLTRLLYPRLLKSAIPSLIA